MFRMRLRRVVAACLVACAGVANAQCYESSILTPAPFLGNHDEIFKLIDGTIWQVQYEYEYLYEYYPAVVICPGKGKLYVAKKELNVVQIGAAAPAGRSKRSPGATPSATTLAFEYFDSKARPAAFLDDDLTIYLWAGKPVAYLERKETGTFDIYGMNGKHLGWLESGIMFDHDGDAVCASADVFKTPPPPAEPKGLKELRPLKSLKELAPLKPLLNREWGELPCKFYLNQGAS